MIELLKERETFHQPTHDELITLAQEFGCCGGEELEYLPGGHHNLVHRYGDVVLRYPKTRDGAAVLKAEFDFLDEINGLRMPRAVGCSEIKGTPVTLIEFIDGVHKDFNRLDSLEVEELARAMCDLHGMTSDCFSATSGTTPTTGGTHADYLQAMVHESVVNRLDGLVRSGYDLSAYDDARQAIDAGRDVLAGLLADHSDEFSGRTFSLLHHDINPGNVLWRPDGTAVFIDPNPTYGDPLDDVNYVITNNQGSAGFQELLLDAYIRESGCGAISAVRMVAYTLKNRLDDLAWTIAMRGTLSGQPRVRRGVQTAVDGITATA